MEAWDCACACPRDADGTRVVAAAVYTPRGAGEGASLRPSACMGHSSLGGQLWNQATLDSFGEFIPRSFVFGPQTGPFSFIQYSVPNTHGF